MKIKAVKFYQAVNFQNSVITHLSLDNPRVSATNLRMDFTDHGVMLESDADRIIISFNNLAYIQLYKDEPKAASKKA